MKKYAVLVTFLLSVFMVSVAQGETGTIIIEIVGIDRVRGQIAIGLYRSRDNFPKRGEAYRSREIRVTGEKMKASLKNLPEGTYAIALFHDSNSNGKFDKGALGVPSEGYGFSNNASALLGPPRFADAAFELKGEKTVIIKLMK
ncbi:MAG: DUF2141 domain-containing protein [Deltaproteobacteria bacterium]|nr:DUF2141 domain-containing protein [Deltaproteobacteria bacterium]